MLAVNSMLIISGKNSKISSITISPSSVGTGVYYPNLHIHVFESFQVSVRKSTVFQFQALQVFLLNEPLYSAAEVV